MLLPDNYRKIFQNKQIVSGLAPDAGGVFTSLKVCVEYSNLSDANEREIFQVSP